MRNLNEELASQGMDPYTLAYLCGHSDFATPKRYLHPQTDTIREGIEHTPTHFTPRWGVPENPSVRTTCKARR